MARSEGEILPGVEDRYFSMRLSIAVDDGTRHLAIGTAAYANDRMGRAYLSVVKPPHELGTEASFPGGCGVCFSIVWIFTREISSALSYRGSMTGNSNFLFDDVAVVSLAACEAPIVVPSTDFDDQLASFYERTGMKSGLLESLAGIIERRQWPADVTFLQAAAMAGEKALADSGIARSRIGLMIDTSVSRQRLEPSSAVTVHDDLGLSGSCMNFDLSNACLGFLNGMHFAGVMIDSGQIDYALIVDAEGSRELQESTIAHLLESESTVKDLFSNFASLTLGSGATAMVLGRHSENSGSRKVVKGFFRADTSYHDLCVGSLSEMRTDASALLDAGCSLAKIAWDDADTSGWLDMDRYIVHQVSRVHTAAIVDVLGIDMEKVPLTFPKFGNIGPAAIPFTLALEADSLKAGDKVLCLGIGSGLNAAVIELLW